MRLPFSSVRFKEGARYDVVCRKGHATVAILAELKFQVLFEIGVNAIIDGYFREAVSCFSASIERFHEFAIRCLVLRDDADALAAAWAAVANQTERQLGAFIFLWLVHFGNPPDILNNKQTSFRNAVIHKGTIPTREQALKFGEAVLDMLREQIRILSASFEPQVKRLIADHLRAALGSNDGGEAIGVNVDMALKLFGLGGPGEPSALRSHLERMAAERQYIDILLSVADDDDLWS